MTLDLENDVVKKLTFALALCAFIGVACMLPRKIKKEEE